MRWENPLRNREGDADIRRNLDDAAGGGRGALCVGNKRVLAQLAAEFIAASEVYGNVAEDRLALALRPADQSFENVN